MILLDTDVMVDILRSHEPALVWLASLGSETVGIPGLVAMELIQGCRNREEQRRVEMALGPFILYWPDRADCGRAFEDFAANHLSQHLSILDALIAETAVGLAVRLATFNQKHYSAVTSLETVQPYRHRSE